jgi:hypothetical protein
VNNLLRLSIRFEPECVLSLQLQRSKRVALNAYPGSSAGPMSFFRDIDPLSSWKVCFGHRHADCKHAYTLKSSIDLWARKFSENVDWDRRIAANQKLAGVS